MDPVLLVIAALAALAALGQLAVTSGADSRDGFAA
jgi:hypothetical protein